MSRHKRHLPHAEVVSQISHHLRQPIAVGAGTLFPLGIVFPLMPEDALEGAIRQRLPCAIDGLLIEIAPFHPAGQRRAPNRTGNQTDRHVWLRICHGPGEACCQSRTTLA